MQVVDEGEWFRVTDVGDGITLIEEPYASDLLSANLWHVRGRDRDLVLDAGLGVAPLGTAVPWLFENDPVLVLSHAHLDHMGGAHEFDDVRVHEAELDEVRAPGPTSLRTARLFELLGLTSYVEPGQPDVLLDALPHDGYDVDAYALLPSASVSALHEGDVIDLGDRAFTVLHLPGHTPGSINLLDVDAGLLLSGDVLYEGGLIDDCVGSDRAAYRTTMRRLIDLDLERALPGHGRALPRDDVRAIASGYLAATDDR